MARIVAVALVVLAALIAWLATALKHVPEFYAQALVADPVREAQGNQDMLRQAAALAGDARKEGRWDALFTAEQINGWLAVDLPKNHPRVMPAYFKEPRVAIEPGSIRVACRYEGFITTILTLEADVYLEAPGVVAVRIKRARAGSVPLPIGLVLHALSWRAQVVEMNLQWGEAEGDPVALVALLDAAQRVDAIEVRAGEIYVAGSTVKDQR